MHLVSMNKFMVADYLAMVLGAIIMTMFVQSLNVFPFTLELTILLWDPFSSQPQALLLKKMI